LNNNSVPYDDASRKPKPAAIIIARASTIPAWVWVISSGLGASGMCFAMRPAISSVRDLAQHDQSASSSGFPRHA
jgi:hypothetical protein